jgi:DNA-binding NtrC family response regulator
MPFSAPPQSGPSPRRPRILLVDDDPIVLRALKRVLLAARPGWEIETAEGGAAALRCVARNGYDVVVTDLHMPQGSGLMLLERLKTEQPSVMRVVHSSHVESLSAEQAHDLAHAVLRKPGRPDEPVVIIDWALDQRRRRLRDSASF